MDIRAFIRELLFGHDCVIVPGFGGFIGNFSPARLDKISGIFYPPVKQITFNRNLNHNDGLLISKISLSTGVNYYNARNLVEEFVRDVNSKLARGEKVVFDNIGTFVNNYENNLQFEPEAGINYFAGSYGLESFHCVPIKDYDVRKRVTRHINKEPMRQLQVRRNLWRAAVIIPALAILIAIPLKTNLFKLKVEASSLNPLVTAEFENNKKAVDEAVVVIPAPVENKNTESSVKAPEEIKSYSIITGSFKSEQNARSHMEKLRADGFTPELNAASNGFFRVTAATCSDIETAVSLRDSILKKFPGTWVSKR